MTQPRLAASTLHLLNDVFDSIVQHPLCDRYHDDGGMCSALATIGFEELGQRALPVEAVLLRHVIPQDTHGAHINHPVDKTPLMFSFHVAAATTVKDLDGNDVRVVFCPRLTDGPMQLENYNSAFSCIDNGVIYFDADQWAAARRFVDVDGDRQMAPFVAYAGIVGQRLAAPNVQDVLTARWLEKRTDDWLAIDQPRPVRRHSDPSLLRVQALRQKTPANRP